MLAFNPRSTKNNVVFANKVDPDEAAHYEPPHLDLHCLPTSFSILSMLWLGQNIF